MSLSEDEYDDTQSPRSQTLGDIFAFCWEYWRRRPLLLGICAVEPIISMGAQTLLPVYAGRFVDAIASGPGRSAEGFEASYDAALSALVVFIALNVVWITSRNAGTQVWIWLASHSMREIVEDAFFKVQRFSTDWHQNAFAGATVRKVSRGMWAFDALGDSFYFGFIPAFLVVCGLTVMLTIQWPMMGLLLAGSILFYLAWNYVVVSRWLSPFNERSAAADTKMGAVLADSITCNATVKSFGAEDREDARMNAQLHDWRTKASGAWTRGTVVSGFQSLHLVFMQGGLLGLGLYLWSVGEATAGQVTLVLTSYFVMHGWVRDIGHHIRDFQKGANDIEDVVKFRKASFGIEDRPGAHTFRPGKGEIVFDRITFCYDGQREPLYADFSLKIAPGEQVALVGKSGSGKSTFVKLVQRLYDVQGGEIRIDGQDIAAVRQDSLRQAIALVPQEPVLFHRSLAENIAYAKPGASRAEVVAAAERARADEFIAKLPQGYETLVGERGVKLSGGERQRVAIARAFLADAPVLVLDEATSSLDSHTEHLIQAAIEELMQGRTTIVIAHRLSTIQRMERILVFSEGRIIEQGSHRELLARPGGRYRELHQLQTEALIAS